MNVLVVEDDTSLCHLIVVDALRDTPASERPRVIVMTGVHSNILSTVDRSVVRAVFFKPLDIAALAMYVKSLAR